MARRLRRAWTAQCTGARVIADKIVQQLIAVSAGVNPHAGAFICADSVVLDASVDSADRIVTSPNLDAIAAVAQCPEPVGTYADGVAFDLIAVGGAIDQHAVAAIAGDEIAVC